MCLSCSYHLKKFPVHRNTPFQHGAPRGGEHPPHTASVPSVLVITHAVRDYGRFTEKTGAGREQITGRPSTGAGCRGRIRLSALGIPTGGRARSPPGPAGSTQCGSASSTLLGQRAFVSGLSDPSPKGSRVAREAGQADEGGDVRGGNCERCISSVVWFPDGEFVHRQPGCQGRVPPGTRAHTAEGRVKATLRAQDIHTSGCS